MKFLAKNPVLVSYLYLTEFLSFAFKRKARPRKREKVLLINMGHLGDVVISTAAIRSVRNAYPECEIGFCGSSSVSTVLATHPDVTHLHIYSHWRVDKSNSGGLWACLRSIKKVGYDVAFDLYPFYPNGGLLLGLSNIPERWGFSSGGWKHCYSHVMEFSPVHVRDLQFQLLHKAGIREKMGYALPASPKKGSYYLIHMGTQDPRKEWHQWQEVVDLLDLPVVLTGAGDREKGMADQIEGAENLVGTLAWQDYIDRIAGADGVLSVDTAASHIASAFAIPSVVLMTELNDREMWKPIGKFSAVAQAEHSSAVDVVALLFEMRRKQACELHHIDSFV